MTAIAPYRPPSAPGKAGFAQALRAEWTKFRTVRGWLIGALVGILLMIGVGVLGAEGGGSSCQAVGAQGQGSGGSCGTGISFTLGPGGEPVSDSFYFVRQPLSGDGTVTVRLTSLTGLVQGPPSPQGNGNPAVPGVAAWAKAGLIIKANLTQGSAYAALMVAADHGVRLQWNYTGDTAGLPGKAGPASPRWLRLARSGDVITGYDSADGTHWSPVGAVTLAGLPATAQVGLFAASPDEVQANQGFGGGENGFGGPTQDTAVFDHLATSGGWTAGAWTGQYVGSPEVAGAGGYHQADGQFTVTGQGDIAPIPAGHNGGPADPAHTLSDYLTGTFAVILAVVVVAALFIAAEYRRGLIRLTLAATPSRGRVLAAKSVVVAVAGFVTGLAGAAVAVLVGHALTVAGGHYAFPVPGAVEARVIVGTGVLAAFASVLALAIGTIVRRSAATVVVVIVVIVVPYFLAEFAAVPLGAGNWLLRLLPAAGFALQQPYPAYQQVTALYAPFSGYFPLSPLAGFGVLAAWTAAALALAAYLLRRRDA